MCVCGEQSAQFILGHWRHWTLLSTTVTIYLLYTDDVLMSTCSTSAYFLSDNDDLVVYTAELQPSGQLRELAAHGKN